MTAHAKLSASGAHRWLACPGSPRLEAGVADVSSAYADEGTRAHTIAATLLESEGNASDDLAIYEDAAGEQSFTDDPAQVAEYIQQYLDYVRNTSGQHLVEQKVTYEQWVPEGFGTADHIAIENGHCVITDLKYGKGKMVFAEENPQGLMYALGTLETFGYLYNIEEFTIRISQPRLDHVDEWQISVEKLLEWGETVKKKAVEAGHEDAPCIPGDEQCMWCKADGCKARANFVLEKAIDGFEGVDGGVENLRVKDLDILTHEQIETLYPFLDTLTSWVKTMHGHAKGIVENGTPLMGYKLVRGDKHRAWVDPPKAERKLKRDLGAAKAFKKKMLSPAQAEKAYGKDKTKLKKLIFKPPGEPTLVPVSDKRPAIETDPTEGFSAVA